MTYTPDSFKASLVWGRIGAAVLALAAFILGLFGYSFGPEDQEQAYTLISSLLAGVAGIMAVVSKVREGKKAK